MKTLKRRLKKLEAIAAPRARRPTFIFIDLPGGKPDRVYYDDKGPFTEWLGRDHYPQTATVVGGVDPDEACGAPLVSESPGTTP